ncbi:MAG: relaxase/mobilization nuclease domain-containing protein [Candidatus Margulisbacteria bacterium]|nr:relaxase/mobilization nuclease domain-containing protein [Candidatus Margulisiibacteriota bacterium]
MTIVKRSNRNPLSTSSFKTLTNYILDTKHNGEKLDYVSISNCLTSDPYFAIKEIEATQSLNQRTTYDKTYHLIVSFREDEKPSSKQIKDIETTLTSAIGLSDHQRICAGHDNTDHYHLHIAINKIHPKTFHMNNPFQDYFKLSKAIETLEQKHGFEVDNHIDDSQKKRNSEPQKVRDMTAHGSVSLLDWIKTNVLPDIKEYFKLGPEGPVNWEGFHNVLSLYNVGLKPHGNGFVISSIRSMDGFMNKYRDGSNIGSNHSVKASSVSRILGKSQLESKLGSFQPPSQSISGISPKMSYSPIPTKTKHHELYLEYLNVKSDTSTKKKQLLSFLSEKKASQFLELKQKYSQARQSIKKDPLLTFTHKKALYSKLKMKKVQEMSHVRQSLNLERHSINVAHKSLTWRDFLVLKSNKKCIPAIHFLRNMKPQALTSSSKKNAISNPDRNSLKTVILPKIEYKVNTKGDVTYLSNSKSIFEDKGRVLNVHTLDLVNIKTALEFAMQKFGTRLSIKGSNQFKDLVIQTVAKHHFPVTFLDTEMEQRKKELKKSISELKRVSLSSFKKSKHSSSR